MGLQAPTPNDMATEKLVHFNDAANCATTTCIQSIEEILGRSCLSTDIITDKKVLAGPASSGRIFSVKLTLLELPSVNIFLTTKIKYSKTFPVCRFIQKSIPSTHFSEFQLFFFDRLFAQKLKKTPKTR